MIRAHGRSWSVATGLVIAVAVAAGCRQDEPAPASGSCLTLPEGALGAAGDPRVDGYLVATHQLELGIAREMARFDSAMVRLAAAHGLPAGDVTPQYVDDVARLVTTDILDHVDGELRGTLDPSACAASRSTALDALHRCERAADCDPRTPDTPYPATCVGRCRGPCDGECSGAGSCITSLPGPCPGACDGLCVPSEPLPCDGQCSGTCDGVCALLDAEGLCQGPCDGLCEGMCRPSSPQPCIGTCYGRCAHEQGDAGCVGATECAGSCSGSCLGECEGDLTPPATASECPASRACQLQARAQGLASMSCEPASVRFEYDLDAGLETEAVAAFEARMRILAEASRTVLETKAYLDLMLGGTDPRGAPLLDPAPLQRVHALVSQSVTEAQAGGLELPSERLDCIELAIVAALDQLDERSERAQRVHSGQTRFIELLP